MLRLAVMDGVGTGTGEEIEIERRATLLNIQVNEKFYKLERVYRYCIKMTRDKIRIYSILHDAPGA